MPVGDANVRRFFEDQGYEVVHLVGLKSPSPMLIAHETPQRLKQAAIDVSEGVDAIIQCGTNLAFAKVAAMVEFWLEKPVIALNTANYWHALRTMGIKDQFEGFGAVLSGDLTRTAIRSLPNRNMNQSRCIQERRSSV